MKKLLLHMCCGPCSITSVRDLQDAGFSVTGLFYNPNIHPLQEYLRRREAAAECAERMGINVIWKDDEYDPKLWLRAVSHREQHRCFHCYSLRLERTHAIAKRGGFTHFSTTLLYSKHQKHEMIRDLGRDIAGAGAPEFLYMDLRSGWKEGIETSKDWQVYRQQYCACIYSENERYAGELKKLL